MDSYISNLKELCDNLDKVSSVSCSVAVYRVLDDIGTIKEGLDNIRKLILNPHDIVLKFISCAETSRLLDQMAYATIARGDLLKGCLPGTRTEVIEAIIGWALDIDLPYDPSAIGQKPPDSSARILWVCGPAGCGKTRVSRSVAAQLEGLGRLGSLYCCDDKNKAVLHQGNLFSTISYDLMTRDPVRKQRLISGIGENRGIWGSPSCEEQFERFLLEPSKHISTIGNTVIVIDAFDEIGNKDERKGALSILTKRAHELPPGLRIIVTSRFEVDIQNALRSPEATRVACLLMDNIPKYSTARDIEIFVKKNLSMGDYPRVDDVARLVAAAGTSFQWAFTACRFIDDGDGTLSPRERFDAMISANGELDTIYKRVLDEHFPDPQKPERLELVLSDIVCVEEPLSLEALASLDAQSFASYSDALSAFKQIVRLLASLLMNTHNEKEPISPFHTSFADFLRSENRSGKYHINEVEARRRLAFDCIDVMSQGLHFNICGITTSFKANREIEKIDDLIQDNISSHLRYACHFWARHFSYLQPLEKQAEQKLITLLQKHFLEWLEVMSLTQTPFHAPLALLEPPVVCAFVQSVLGLTADLLGRLTGRA